jgi:glycosyltransferase involved in cell wall biosynthesis
MSFLVITHVKHTFQNGQYYAYGPYVREMNLWFKYVKQVTVIAPLDKSLGPDKIDLAYEHPSIKFIAVPEFHFTSVSGIIKSVFVIPYILFIVCWHMMRASHIHLRCPGNMGLLGALIQILFPWKKKTAKYAGNWDPKSKQPLSYRLQKWILRNTWLTHQMKALVYGDWPNRTKNILPFFTASYSETDKKTVPEKSIHDKPLRFIYVGTLTPNKQPLLALDVFYELFKMGKPVEMHFYGEGIHKQLLIEKIASYHLADNVFVHGNVDAEILKAAYLESHFLLFFSKSEGWPKAVAEAMWWGCVPITTPVSCVPWMIQSSDRGLLINQNTPSTIAQYMNEHIEKSEWFSLTSKEAIVWSRKFTLDFFGKSISHFV